MSAPALPLRVLIIAEHASARFGGEAILPLHYFRGLRRRGIEAWLITHARTRDELLGLLPAETGRMHFVPDTPLHRAVYRLGHPLPSVVRCFTTDFLNRLLTQFIARRLARRLVRRHAINVIHQPIPVSPRETSLLHTMNAPVVIGPMNGDIDYPPAFRHLSRRSQTLFLRTGRRLSGLMHLLMPGKRRAAILLVANERTRAALPAGLRGRVITLVENGIDSALWQPASPVACHGPVVRFVFAGRLVDFKGADLLLQSFHQVRRCLPAVTLDVIGDGPMRKTAGPGPNPGAVPVRHLSRVVVASRMRRIFRQCDVFVLPTLAECGGAVILEAMACGLPVISTAWGGPADYLDDSCGVLVPPESPESFVQNIARAMRKLAEDPALRQRLGCAARQRVVACFDWGKKIDAMIDVYQQAIALSNRDARCMLRR